MGGILVLRGRHMDRTPLLWAGARGGGGAAPRHSPLRPAGGTSVEDFLHHMLRLGDFAWEPRNHRLGQLFREPLSAAAQAY